MAAWLQVQPMRRERKNVHRLGRNQISYFGRGEGRGCKRHLVLGLLPQVGTSQDTGKGPFSKENKKMIKSQKLFCLSLRLSSNSNWRILMACLQLGGPNCLTALHFECTIIMHSNGHGRMNRLEPRLGLFFPYRVPHGRWARVWWPTVWAPTNKNRCSTISNQYLGITECLPWQ